MNHKIKTLNKMIENKTYIFVDCFDTMVFRTIKSDRIIYLWLDRLATCIGIEVSQLESIWKSVICGNKEKLQNNKEEQTFRELCDELYFRIMYYIVLEMTSSDFYELSLNTMLDIEMSVDYTNIEIINWLREKHLSGKRIFCVSDFYLPEEAMKKIFSKLNIIDLFDGIFVSSEYGKRKSSGNLYKKILETKQISPQDILMIGDNKRSDYLMPKKLSIEAYRYKDVNTEIDRKQQFHEMMKLYKKYNKDEYFLNYEFLFYTFCERLYEELAFRKVKKIYFMSREGAFFKRMFDTYCELQDNNFKIETVYVYVSRQSTFIPSLKELDEEDFSVLKKDAPNISIASFIRNLNLYEEIKSNRSFLDKFNLEEIINDFFSSESYAKLKKDNFFREIYENKRKEQKKEILTYFDSIGIVNDEEVNFVDIGWKGSIQDNIVRMFDNQKKVYGYYLGLIGNVTITEVNKKIGLIFTSIPMVSTFFDVFKIRYRLLERISYASHGSCVCYENGKPMLGAYTDEEKLLYEFVQPFQEKMIHEINNIYEFKQNYLFSRKDWDIFVMCIYSLFCIDINRERLSRIEYMDGKLVSNFGNRGVYQEQKNFERIKYLFRYFYHLSYIEKIQKILMMLYKCRLVPIAYIVKKVSGFFVKTKTKKLLH